MKVQKFRKILCVETRIGNNWPTGDTIKPLVYLRQKVESTKLWVIDH